MRCQTRTRTRRVLQKLKPWGVATILFLFCQGSGCPTEEFEEEKEKGEYQVHLDTLDVELNMKEASPSVTVPIEVKCFGKELPPGCNSHNPRWQLDKSEFLQGSFIANRQSPETQLVIQPNRSAIAAWQAKMKEEHGIEEPGYYDFIHVTPTKAPGSLRITGERYIDVYVWYDIPEQAPSGDGEVEKKKLSVDPPEWTFKFGVDDDPAARDFKILINGEEHVEITGINFTGPHAEFFRSSLEAMTPAKGSDGQKLLTFPVGCEKPPWLHTYDATMHITYTGGSTSVSLKAIRK